MSRRPRFSALLKYLILVVIGLLFGLVGVEIGLRMAAPSFWKTTLSFDTYDWLTYHPILGWMNQPGYERADFRINQLGWRGGEVAVAKQPGALRIVCLGDSRTFGIWLDRGRFRFNNDYPAALADRLRRGSAGSPVEVINAGVIGYNSANGLRQLYTQVADLQPDIVTIAFGMNDHLPSWKPALRCEEPRNPSLRALFYSLADLRTFQLGVSLYQVVDAFHLQPFSVRWVEPDEYAYNLRRIAAAGRRLGIRVMFVTQALRPLAQGDSVSAFPGAPQATSPYFVYGANTLSEVHEVDNAYLQILRQVAGEEGVAVADGAAAFAAHAGAGLFGPYDFVHANPKGAQALARTIDATLLDLGWLEHAPGSLSSTPTL